MRLRLRKGREDRDLHVARSFQSMALNRLKAEGEKELAKLQKKLATKIETHENQNKTDLEAKEAISASNRPDP